jgi:alpha-N-arabinofuranosidase
MKIGMLLFLSLVSLGGVSAGEFHVATGGKDSNDGTRQRPFRTISAAARVAQPGDVITVHGGVYRERISPPRGGESDDKRIVYQAAPGEKVEIKGSEVIKNWVKVRGIVWKATIPGAFFGGFNPYSDLIRGDWFDPMGRDHHTGAVYLEGNWLTEAVRLDDVLNPVGKSPLWFGVVDSVNTTIWAQFRGINPNERVVEINVRRTVFYPSTQGINYITVRGFTLEHAATPWAPPTAEQIGVIGTHWSKGWIIENNVVRYSKCAGIALGKYGDEWDNTSANAAEGYVKTIDRALANGWNKETIGHHIVRNNTISECEQAGIVGSLGAVFSQITGNHIYNIWTRRLFSGAEMAGIKIHASIDVLIRNNRIHNVGRGMWMDWMAQGTRITGNLCYDNSAEDIFFEVDHGPFLVDNNLFLSGFSVRDMSEGGAFVHNLMAGRLETWPEPNRSTPYHRAHSTALAGMSDIKGGDDRFYNNIFLRTAGVTDSVLRSNIDHRQFAGFGLCAYDSCQFPLQSGGNVYYNGACPYGGEANPLILRDVDPKPTIVEHGERVYLGLALGRAIRDYATSMVTTDRLGKARIPGLPYENPDGTPLKIDRDYFGSLRDSTNPSAGPFARPGQEAGSIKVW